MRRLKVTLEYDGTHFAGFQKQSGTDLRTVQGVLEESLVRLTGKETPITGAGRTDSGVHALGQVVHFETGSSIPVERFCRALNGKLPPDIKALDAVEVDASFHARRSASGKKYRYLVFNSRKPLALWRNYCYRFPFPLEMARVKECAAVLTGEHDYRAFSAAGSSVKSTVRHLYSVDAEQQGDWVRFSVIGNGFLYKMMRIYQKAQVQHYWLLDPQEKTLECFAWRDGVYALVASGMDEDIMEHPNFAGLSIALKSLWSK
jgi:tRNA pseudouridine38-40 synthase